ncbi:MAG: hypothetical protein ACE5GL_10895, partial [Calditrichia bacterium]
YPAGFTAVYPRKMLVKQKEYICWNCGDFSIEKQYRTLGVAVKLRKEAKRYVDERKIPFLYAHPNDRMLQVHLRARHKKIGHMKRFALPVRVSKYIGKNVIGKIAGQPLDLISTVVLKLKFKKTGEYENLPAKEMNFNGQYAQLCEEINTVYPVVGLRDEKFLNWKFKNHPIREYKLFNYYENGNLSGYIIYSEYEDTLNISEIVSKTDKSLQENLISTFIRYCIEEKNHIAVLSTVTLEFNPTVPVLERLGFKFRDDATSSVIAYSADPELKALVEDGRNWFMNVGDRDA